MWGARKLLHAKVLLASLLIIFVEGGGVLSSFVTQNELRQRNCSLVRGLHANLIRFITKEGFHRELEDTVEVLYVNIDN